MPVAAGYLWWWPSWPGAFLHGGATVNALLIGIGLVTALPLFLFAFAARRLPYSTVGILQYIGPSLQLPSACWSSMNVSTARARLALC